MATPTVATDCDPTAPDPAALSWTIDELAAASGVPTRTIRLYQSEKVLPPPTKDGRVARYGPDHLERLRLIASLQDRGLGLKAIRDALREVTKGRMSLEAWLELGVELRRPWSDHAALLVSDRELTERLGDDAPGLRAALVRAELLEPADGVPPRWLLADPGLLDVVRGLREAGVDVEDATAAIAVLRKRMRRPAQDLAALLLERAAEAADGDPEALETTMAALRPLTAQAASLVFVRQVERAMRERVDAAAPTLVKRRKDGDR